MKNIYAVAMYAHTQNMRGTDVNVSVGYAFAASKKEAESLGVNRVKQELKATGWTGHGAYACMIPWDEIKAVMAENEAGLTNNET